ncbi:MAG TPA: type VI secretion system tube protein Hcp, partial [Humisphaera sp.]
MRAACELLEQRTLLSVSAGDDMFNISRDTPLTLGPAALLGNDVGATRVTAFGPALLGTVTPTGGGGVIYTPPAGFVGTDSFTYTAAAEAGVRGNLLTIPAVPGVSTVGAQLKLASYTFGGTSDRSIGSTRPAGASRFDELVIQTDLKGASPGLLSALTVGRSIATDTQPLTLVTRDADNKVVVSWRFSKVFVAGYESADSDDTERPLDTIRLVVGTATMSVAQYDSAGASTTPVTATWDVVRNTGSTDPISSTGGFTLAAPTALAAPVPSEAAPVAAAPVGRASHVLRLGADADVAVTSAEASAQSTVQFGAGGPAVGTPELGAFRFTTPIGPTAARLFGNLFTGRPLPSATYTAADGTGRATTTWTLGDPTNASRSAVFVNDLKFAADDEGNVTESISLLATGFAQTATDADADGVPRNANPSNRINVLTGTTGGTLDFGPGAAAAGPGSVTLELSPRGGSDVGGSLDVSSYTFGADASVSFTSGGGTSFGRPAVRELVVTAPAGSATSGFVDMLATGRSLDGATVRVRDAAGVVRQTVALSEVYTTGYEVSDEGSADPAARPLATIRLAFRSATETVVTAAGSAATGQIDAVDTSRNTGTLAPGGDARGTGYRLYFLQNATNVGSTLPQNTPFVDVDDASWSADRPTSIGSGSTGATSGTAKFGVLSFSAVAGRQSVGLLGSLATARKYDRAVLYRLDETGRPSLGWTLGSVFVSAYGTGANAREAAVDQVELSYGSFATTTFQPTGTLTPVVTSGWDVVRNTANGLAGYVPPPDAFGGAPVAGPAPSAAAAPLPAATALAAAAVTGTTTISLPPVTGAVAAELAVDDYDFNTTAPVTINRAAPPTLGRATFGGLSFSHVLDGSYPAFLRLAAAGTLLPTVHLTSNRPDGKPYLVVTLSTVYVSGVDVSLSVGGAPVETVRLAYGSMTQSYTEYSVAGAAKPALASTYNQIQNTTSGSGFVTGADINPTPTGQISFGSGKNVEVIEAVWRGAEVPVSLDGTTVFAPTLGSLSFTVAYNRQSPGVFKSLTSGANLGTVTYTSRDGQGKVLGTWTLGGSNAAVYLTSQKVAVGRGGALETFTLVAGRYAEAAPASDGGVATAFSYNVTSPAAPQSFQFGGGQVPDNGPTDTGRVFVTVSDSGPPDVPPPPPPPPSSTNRAPTDVALSPASVAENV